MDKEEKYWSNLEKLYVHNVYEKISHRYDEFLRMSTTSGNNYDEEQSSDAETTIIKATRKTTTTTTTTQTIEKASEDNQNETGSQKNTTVTTKSECVIKNGGCCMFHSNQLTLDLNNNNTSVSHVVCNFKNTNSPILKFKQRNFRNIRHSKHNPWPKVKNFLLNLDRYSLIGIILLINIVYLHRMNFMLLNLKADVGCGDGKYLNVNNHILSIGSDRSVSLCKLASSKIPPVQSVTNQNQIVVCDNLALPFK
jgi:hypothetical protein